jgi:hypothetical protein
VKHAPSTANWQYISVEAAAPDKFSRQKCAQGPAKQMSGAAAGGAGGAPVLRFRNYRPQESTVAAVPAEVIKPADAPSVQLRKQLATGGPLLPAPPPAPGHDDAAAAGGGAGGGAAAAAAPADAGEAAENPDAITIAPRKPNWDLKRDVAAKLELLDRQTERALAEIVRRTIAARAAEAGSAGAGAGAGARGGAGEGAGGGAGAGAGAVAAGAGLAARAAGPGAAGAREEELAEAALRAMDGAESSARWGGAEDIDV